MKWLWCCAGLCLLAACDSRPQLTIGHSPDEPGSLLAKTLPNEFAAHFQISVEEFGNQHDVKTALQAGRIQFAIIEQPLQPQPELRLVTPLYRSVLHVLVRQRINDCSQPVLFTDLVKKGAVYAGPPGTAGYQLLQTLSADGWLPDLAEIDLLDNPLGREPDVFIQFGGILSRDAINRLPDFCLASLGLVERLGRGAWAEGISYRLPQLTPFILPAGIYPQLNSKPVLSLAVTHLLVTHAEMDGDVIYDVLSLIKENANTIGAIDPLVNATIHEDFRHERLNVPLHPGTQRYLQRNAPTFLERYAELLAFVITALVALSSAAVAIVRIRRQAKKDRIDRYLNQLITARAAFTRGDCNASELHEEVSALQAKVTQLVVDERLIADTTFMAFLTLSNQVLNESKQHTG